MHDAEHAASAVYELADDEVLISRSDLQGRITYANQTFVEVSGYSLDEIMGEPHSLFRHPSMPKAVFKNLWETIEAGKTWQGLIKNRRHTGEGCWMHTTVAPLLDGKRVVGYTSIRRKASAKAIKRAERVYAAMQQGRVRGVKLHYGALRRTGLRGWMQRFSFSSIQAKLIGMVLASIVLLLMAAAAGVHGLTSSAERLQTLNQTGLQGVSDLQQIDQRVSQALQALEPAVRNPRRADLDMLESQLTSMNDSIEQSWQGYTAGRETGSVQAGLKAHLSAFLESSETTLTAIRDGNGFAAFEAFNDIVQPTSESISGTINVLVEQERTAAHTLMEVAEQQQQVLLYGQLGVLLLGVLIMVGLSMAVLKSLI